MKFFATIVAASVAVASAAEICDVAALRGLVTSPDVAPCSAATGYTLVPPAGPPTDAEVAKMCANKNCVNLVSSVLATNPKECQVPIGGKIMLRADLLDKVSNACNAGAPPAVSSAAPAASVAPGASSAAPAVSVAPGADDSSVAPITEVSEAPVVTEAPAGSLSSSSGSLDDVVSEEPEAGSPETSPSPAPTKSAAVVSTVGVAAVAASVAFMMAA